jgi:hypothetical protein
MARKRAPGAGRKPKGDYHGKSAVFSTRITSGLRKNLDDAARKSGRSLSQEVERRLKDSFGIQSDRDPAVRALCYLVGELAIRTCGDWRHDPWHFEAFRAGLNGLLDRLAPVGPIEPPKELPSSFPRAQGAALEWLMSPQGFGELIAGTLLVQLETEKPPPAELGIDVPAGSWPYAMPQARRDLDLPLLEIDRQQSAARYAPIDPARKYSSQSAGAWSEESASQNRTHGDSK